MSGALTVSKRRSILFLALTIVLASIVGSILLFQISHEDAALLAAREALEQRDFRQALRHLSPYLSRRPNDGEARRLAAQAARREGDLEQAERHLHQATGQRFFDAALNREARLLALQQGDPDEAKLTFAHCIARPDASDTPLALEALIVADFNRLVPPLAAARTFPVDEMPPVVARLRQAIDLWLELPHTPADQVQGLVWRGRLRGLSGDHSAALADLEQAIGMDPRHFEARAYYALSIAQSQPVESLRQMELLLQQYPGDARIQYAVATGRRGVGDLDQARPLLDEILREDPASIQALVERALLALDEKQPAEAKPFLHRALKVDANFPEVHLALARYMAVQGDTAAAKRHQDRFLALDAQRIQPPQSNGEHPELP